MNEMLNRMFDLDLPLLEKVLRPIVVYAFLVAALRLAGKRELAQMNPLDLIVLLTLSNTVQNAIIGSDNSVTGGLVGAATLLGVNQIATRVLSDHPRLDRLVEGKPTPLIADGKILREHLKREGITEEELRSVVHRQGIDRLEDVEAAVLETSGTINVSARHPTPGERQMTGIEQRLASIEALLRTRAKEQSRER